MSLKKQVKEMKAELNKRDDELFTIKKNMKHTRTFELEQEIKVYRDELLRLRFMCEQSVAANPNPGKATTSAESLVGGGYIGGQPTSLSQGYLYV